MKIIENLQEINFSGTAVTIGFFDGVHKGHAALLSKLVSQAKEKGLDVDKPRNLAKSVTVE